MPASDQNRDWLLVKLQKADSKPAERAQIGNLVNQQARQTAFNRTED